MTPEAKKKLYNACWPDESLEPDDPRYVECDDIRDSAELIQRLEQRIRLTDTHTCQLFSGHRGCGKTSELYRLRKLLTEDSAYFVVYCEADRYLDLNDKVEYTEVLLALVQQVVAEAAQHSISLSTSWFTSLLGDLKNQLQSPVHLKDVKVKTGLIDFGFDIKNNPNYREIVRQGLRPQTTEFMTAVNEVLEKAGRDFRNSDANCQGLVVIVDNLDRLFRRTLPDTSYTTHDELFINSARQLGGLACHVIYTLPPELIHSLSGAQLKTAYDCEPEMLPMIPVAKRDGGENEDGIQTLMRIIERRLECAGALTAFDSKETLRRLASISGGYVRGLMTLLQETILVSKSSLTAENVESAIQSRRRSYTTALGQEHWEILQVVARSHKIGVTENELKLLANHAVLKYQDQHGPWYDINPVLREAPEMSV